MYFVDIGIVDSNKNYCQSFVDLEHILKDMVHNLAMQLEADWFHVAGIVAAVADCRRNPVEDNELNG